MRQHSKNIHNMDSLQREIYRLKLEAKNIEQKLEDNAEYLHKHFPSMTMNSFAATGKKESDSSGVFNSFVKNETIAGILNAMGSHIADRVMENIDSLVDKAFHREKKKQ